MVKKILGGVLFLVAALTLIGSIVNGSFVGAILPVILNITAGIFFIGFDGVYKKAYIDGIKYREKQCIKIVLFIIAYVVLIFFAGIGAGISGTDNFILTFIVSVLPHFVSLIIFAGMLAIYATPLWACQKNFNLKNSLLNEYLSVNETFNSYSEDDSVLASGKVLFFPKTFCIIPFEHIDSVEFKNMGIEQDVIFKLKNGKKIGIVASKKKYDNVNSAISANIQSNNL